MSTLEYSDDDRDLLLAASFELWLTRSAFDDDPTVEQRPIGRIRDEDISDLVANLDGDPEQGSFGAHRDRWAEVYDVPVPEYLRSEPDGG